MSRIALSSLERAQREILPLDLALYHAARDYPGGAAAIAATTGRNPTTLQHKLSPTHPSHSINIQEFGEILELTKDRRILDAVHALVGDTIWQELADTYTNDMPETLTTGIAEYFRQVADLAEFLNIDGVTRMGRRQLVLQRGRVAASGGCNGSSAARVIASGVVQR